ncbi:double-strand break repair helicase AddA, partial [Escherichia coli]|nr:double-strand break repair helicase AddA [Escherichia coli]
MSAKTRFVQDATRESQSTASDPGNSVWVSAHAGSGKTHVLSQRVIRLLLLGTDPSRILCLTYTRAAAANMSRRVFETLAKWTELPDAELSRRIEEIEGAKPSRALLHRARTLFAEALETPGGLKVQTIHAFCESVLHQFPLEANIAAHFQMLDTRMEAALVAEARRDMISGAAGGGSPALTEAFATILERGGEFGLDVLLGEIVAKRDRLRNFIEAADDGGQRFEDLFAEFGFTMDDTAESIAQEVWPLPGFPPDVFSDFVAIGQRVGGKTIVDDILPEAIAGFNAADPVERLSLLARGFLKKDGDPYDSGKTFKKLIPDMPDVVERYMHAVSALIAATDRLALFRMVEGTRAALIVADRLIQRYENLKASRGFLDFNDLITRTHRLLSRAEAGAWVQYKLDQGIDHILIDEAQDTSPEQWEVVRALTAEFFVGEGARGDLNRTVFAVGDEKQSIYSFQGASPDAFGQSGELFGQFVRQAGKPFRRVELKQSFRSTNDVLHAVDRVFDNEETRRGVASGAFTHDTTRVGDPGYVELWPYESAQTVDEPEDWTRGVDHAKAPAVLVADKVARTIKHWLDTHEVLEGQNRRVKPGDVMVLVRKRDRFVHALSRALKDRGVDVAGADRLLLASHIAIKDLIALGRVLIQREDDLALAAILKSPLFGLSEDALFRLASDRPQERSLYAWMAHKAQQGDAALAAVVAQLQDWGAEAAFRPAFEFYARVLGRDQGRRKFIARLGHEAGEILDEFLTFCLAEEMVGLPGLEEMLTTLETAGPEIKREMDQGRDEVRILTVHASKGLEAPIVFLVDSGSPPSVDAHLPRLTPFSPRSEALEHVEGFVWRSSKDVANVRSKGIEQHLRRLAEEEYRRLLYV